jgi:hypothetical protein
MISFPFGNNYILRFNPRLTSTVLYCTLDCYVHHAQQNGCLSGAQYRILHDLPDAWVASRCLGAQPQTLFKNGQLTVGTVSNDKHAKRQSISNLFGTIRAGRQLEHPCTTKHARRIHASTVFIRIYKSSCTVFYRHPTLAFQPTTPI